MPSTRQFILSFALSVYVVTAHGTFARAVDVATPGSLRLLAFELVNEYVKSRGEVNDPEMTKSLLGILDVLNAVAKFGDFEKLYIVNDRSINAVATVLGTSLATLAVMHLGFQQTILLGVAVYAVGWTTVPRDGFAGS